MGTLAGTSVVIFSSFDYWWQAMAAARALLAATHPSVAILLKDFKISVNHGECHYSHI
jgi:hypothetical protein